MRLILSSLILVILFFNLQSPSSCQAFSSGIFPFIPEDAFDDELYDRAFERFIQSHTRDREAQTLSGIYVKGLLHSSIVPQPIGNSAYVSNSSDVVTEFSMARQFGSIGLLAHNTQAGSYFDEISIGDEILLVYRDGKTVQYSVTEFRAYQALTPSSPYSSFIQMDQPGIALSAEKLFLDTYGVPDRLILQTCISKGQDDTWGRLFIIATQSANP